MKTKNEGEKLLSVASNLKNDVKVMQSKLHTHSLLIEAINAVNAENVKAMNESSQKFTKTVSKIKRDPRNKIIVALLLAVVFLMVYLLEF